MTLDDLIDDVQMDAPRAPRLTIKGELLRAMSNLCIEGNAWVHRSGPVVVAANTPHAELEAPPGAIPVRIISLESSGKPLRPGVHYNQQGPSSIDLSTGMKTSTLYGALAVKPKRGEQMPDELVDAHAETLKHGALYRLMMLPQPWQSSELAVYHRRYWEAGVTRAKQIAAYGHQAGGSKIRSRQFI